jgi:hypothetical protein
MAELNDERKPMRNLPAFRIRVPVLLHSAVAVAKRL